MENVKQFQISFDKGITNVPSDVLCGDNETAELVGMTYEAGELKPIQNAKDTGELNQRILYVHQVATEDNYITIGNSGIKYYKSLGDSYSAGGEIDTTITSVKDIKAIGNTLIVSTTDGMIYYLWNGNGYTKLGDKIPEPYVIFKLYETGTVEESQTNPTGAIAYARPVLDTMEVADQEEWNNFVYGLYAKLKKDANSKKSFTMPFAVRYALELYDGSLIYHSSPILFFPARTKNFSLSAIYISDGVARWTARMKYSQLKYRCQSDYSEWSDIVRGIKLFVSDEYDIYNTSTDAVVDIVYSGSLVVHDYIKATSENPLTIGMQLPGEETIYPTENHFFCDSMTPYPFADTLSALSKNGLFYELCTLKNTSGDEKPVDDFKGSDLQNITTRTQMTGEYYSHCKYFPNYMYPYNGRLHIADFSRSFFEGYVHFTGHDLPLLSSVDTYTIYVTIKTSIGNRVVSKTITATTERIGAFFFYPDTRANSVTIYSQNNSGYFTKELKEHPSLNGAYYIENPLDTISYVSGIPSITVNTEPEYIYNKIVVSEVDNPFVFNASGYATVGNGRIMAMTSNTNALSQGQFGQYPLFAFSSDGIWALATNSTGTYSSVHPFSREICNNVKSITQTDSSIFFTSEKGLMMIFGGAVKCVSEHMGGRNLNPLEIYNLPINDNTRFLDYLRTCDIAYDYRDCQLLLLNGGNYHYVFNIKSGAFSKKIDTSPIAYTSDNYPDSLMQTQDNKVLSLMGKPNINEDETEYSGYILTRPIKFKNILTLKSIRQIKHIKDMVGDMNIRILASNDCRQWVELSSLRGKPWKYYRIAYTFTQMNATDRFAGTVFLVEERRSEKLR